MVGRAYHQASALVFDLGQADLAMSRRALVEFGFEDVSIAAEFSTFISTLELRDFDLVIADANQKRAEVCAAVRGIRGGSLGGNPFAGVILTTWERTPAGVREAIDSGADAVLVRPFSQQALTDRVTAIASSRKGFIVTSDYIGPDRRKDPDRQGGPQVMHPPNTLKAALANDVEALKEARGHIQESAAAMSHERMRRLAMRVATAARLSLERGVDGADAEDLDRAARELRRRLRQSGFDQAVRVAAVLTQVTEAMVAEGRCPADDLAIARDLAMAVFAVVSTDPQSEAAAAAADEVERVLTRVTARLAVRHAVSGPRLDEATTSALHGGA